MVMLIIGGVGVINVYTGPAMCSLADREIGAGWTWDVARGWSDIDFKVIYATLQLNRNIIKELNLNFFP
jgi:hypothetical protein